MESNKFNPKEKALIKNILTQRKESAKIISNILYNKLYQNISKKEYIIIKRIIIVRKNNSIKIQSFFRGYMIRKKIQYYISKIRTCYLIETGFSQTFKNLQMIVLYNNKNKVFDLCYDKFFNKYIFFMDRALINKDIYKIQFINEGKIIIDSNHETFEENGIYCNIIDFKKIKKKEEKYLKKNKTQIKSSCKFLKEKNILLIPKNININDNEEKDNNEFKSRESLDISGLGGSTRIETPIKALRNDIKIKNLGSSSLFSKKKSCKLKGILKLRSLNRKLSSKQNSLKVKFGDIEFLDN